MAIRKKFYESERKAIWERDNVDGKIICRICKCALNPFGFHIDHIIPVARGGVHHLSNWQILCPTCNTSKQAKSMAEAAGTILSEDELANVLGGLSLLPRKSTSEAAAAAPKMTTPKPKVATAAAPKVAAAAADYSRCEYILRTTGKRCRNHCCRSDPFYCSTHSKVEDRYEDPSMGVIRKFFGL